MDSSRRNLLRLCATLSGVGLAGCSSDDSVSFPTDTPTGSPTASRTPTSTATEPPTTEPPGTEEPTATEPEPSPTPVANADLAGPTATILEEVPWFATEYDDAVHAYRNAINRLLATISQIRDSADISAHDLERLRNGIEDVATVTAEEIAPHFDVHDRLVTPENAYYRNVEKFAHRGDWDRADEELAEMYHYYDMRQRWYVIAQELSNDPVQGFLLDALRADEIPADLRKRHGVAQGVDPALFELYYPPADYRAYAYTGDSSLVYGHPIDHHDRNAFRQFAGVEEEVGRTGQVYVVADLISRTNPKRWTYELPNEVVYLQGYSSSGAATRAVERMLRSAVSQEGTETLGGREWLRVYYYYDGDITYAYLLQAGRFLLSVAPSRTAWEERPEHWHDPLKLTWLWS